MSKRKRHKRKKRRSAPRRAFAPHVSPERGFDFGVELHEALVTDLSFVQYLQEAGIIACAYGAAPASPLGPPMFCVSLVGTNADPLAKAFTEFKRWASSGDGDVVELTFIFLKDSGYILSICRDYSRAITELLGPGRAYSPIIVGAVYNKRLDTRGRTVEEFREYKTKHLISPFLFGAATVSSKSAGAPSAEQVEPLLGIEPILKFEAGFVDEESLKPGTAHYSAIALARHTASPGRKKARPPLPRPLKPSQHTEGHFRYRAGILKRHFPVTVERIRTGRYPEVMRTLRESGVRDWQIEQAVANLLLSSSLCNGHLFYEDSRPGDLTKRIGEAIQQREERSDTAELTRFSTHDILAQVKLDAVALLRAEGRAASVPIGLDNLQKTLASLGLLEPPDA